MIARFRSVWAGTRCLWLSSRVVLVPMAVLCLVIGVSAVAASFRVDPGEAASLPSAIDAGAYEMYGMREVDPLQRLVVINPTWFLPFFFVAGSACWASTRWKSFSAQIVSRSHSRVCWGCSLVLWVVLASACWVACYAIVCGLLGLMSGVSNGLSFTSAVTAMMGAPAPGAGYADALQWMAAHAVWLVALGSVAAFLSIAVKPVLSFFACLVVLVASVYEQGVAFLPDLAMAARGSLFVAGGASPEYAALVGVVWFALAAVGVIAVARRYEFR